MAVNWHDPWIISGLAVGGFVLLLLIIVAIWLISLRTCCRPGRRLLEAETTVDRTPAPVDLQQNDYLHKLMLSNPKATSISQYGKK